MEIVRTTRFKRDVKRIGASAEDVEELELALAQNPEAGGKIPGLGGVRKVRFGYGGTGKRGGGRAIYMILPLNDGTIALLRAYGKSEQEDMTPKEKRGLAALVKEIMG